MKKTNEFLEVKLTRTNEPLVLKHRISTNIPNLSKIITNTLMEKYIAAMVLAGVGDSLGYKNGKWEFCRNGVFIHEQFEELTNGQGISYLEISYPKWNVSDDTVMAIATAEGLLDAQYNELDTYNTYRLIGRYYHECIFKDMAGRAPGMTCKASASIIGSSGYGYDRVPYNSRHGGCGASMRACPIGLYYSNYDDIITSSIICGKMTHNNPVGYLGSLNAAVFTRYGIDNIPIVQWPLLLVQILNKVSYDQKIEKNDFEAFLKKWNDYISLRHINSSDKNDIAFPQQFGIQERDKFYKSLSFSGIGGASGDDSCIIAYDALLGAVLPFLSNRETNEISDTSSFPRIWQETCLRGMLHAGDSDSTGILCATWYGALFGFNGVSEKNYSKIEYFERLVNLGMNMHNIHKKQ